MIPQYRIEQYLNAINAAYMGESPLPEYPAEPVWRIEGFLAAILSAVKGDSPVMACPDPVWHIEEFARAIYDALTGASPAWPCPTATNNIEAILHAIYKVVADGTETDGIATSWDIERWLLDSYDAAKQGGGGTTLSGTLPLTLANAISHAIVSLTRYGLCTQDGTPTPDAPVDIMCNNGTLKWDSVNQRVYADGTPEVLTVGGPNLLNPATNITGKYITASGGISAGSDAQYTDLIPVKEGETYVCSLVSGRNSGNNRWHAYNENGTWVKQLASVSASGQQWSKLTMAVTIDSGISYVRLSYGIDDTEAMIEGIISDSISDKFYEGEMLTSKGRLKSLTEIQSPYTSTISNRCPATMYSVVPGRYYSVKNNVPPAVDLFTGFYASVDDVTDISKSVGNAYGSSFFAPNGANYAVTVYLKQVSGTTYTFDKPIVSEVSTDYSPYVPQQTASVPMLLSVGDYKDEAELISGLLTHKVGIRILTGEETGWALSDSGTTHRFRGTKPSNCYTPASRAPSVCTHFKYVSTGSAVGGMFIGASQYWYFIPTDQTIDTVDEWTDWLASQYAAGTPVIVVYPLATETTEQTTAQRLSTYEGTNIVDSVANVSPLTAEVTYKANA